MQNQSFASNGKVSIRQMSRMMFLELFGLGTLVLPGPLAKICQTDGVFAILSAAAIWSVILHCVCGRTMVKTQNEQPEKRKKGISANQASDESKTNGKVEKKVKAVFQILFFAAAGGFLFYMITSLVERQLLDSNYLWIIVATIFFAGGYGIMKGIECRARIYEILFWILMIPLGIILLIALWNVHPDYWLPVFSSGWVFFLLGVAVSFVAFLPAGMCIFLRPACAEPERVGHMSTRTVLMAGVGCAFVYLILVGIFQPGLLSALKYPIISLMSVVQMPGNLMERLDAPMVTIWFFCLFALFHSLCYYCVDGIQKLFPSGKKIGRKVWIGMILILLSSLLLLLHGCGKKGPEENMYPLSIGIAEEKNTGQMVMSYAMPAIAENGSSGGGSGSSLESDSGTGADVIRTVTADSLFQAQEILSQESDKTLDLNHMKVFIISREILRDEEQKELLFTFFLENENMAWNTCLLFTEENMEDLFAGDVTGGKSMGFYIEDLLNSRQDIKEKSVFTVKDFMSLYQNKTETMLAPIVSLQDGEIAIEEYCIISRCGDRGTLSAEDGAYVNMLLGKQKTLSLVLEDDEYATLQDIRLERTIYIDENGNPKQEILIKGNLKLSADWLFDWEEKEVILEEARAKVEDKLNRLVTSGKKENHADLTNSYLGLSGYDRKLWKLYRENPDAYEKKLETTIKVKLKMLDT